MARKKTQVTFPQELLVQHEIDPNDDEGGYFVAHRDLDSIGDDQAEVAVYRFVEVRKLQITRELV